MKKITLYKLFFAALFLFGACKSNDKNKLENSDAILPVVSDSGSVIKFPKDSAILTFFKTETVGLNKTNSPFTTPAYVAATSGEGYAKNMILFNNPDLAASFTAMMQNRINIQQKAAIIEQKNAIIKQKQVELDRFKDLASHGAGTGKDVADAQTDLLTAQTDMAVAQNELANEKNAILEHEADLKMAGFDPSALSNVEAGRAWIICDIPETQISTMKKGNDCVLSFTSYPGETFNAQIENIAEIVDNSTRMVKVRLVIPNKDNKLKTGMYATAMFAISNSGGLSIPASALITVQGNSYVFVEKEPGYYERKQVVCGSQYNNRVVIVSGLNDGDAVVNEGAMQLKGISFGY